MISYDDIQQSMNEIVEQWGEDGKKVIECAFAEHRKMSTPYFLDNCVACGGNWGGMLLSGLKVLYPQTYDAIPAEMGHLAFALICNTMLLCGVDTAECNGE